MVKRLFMVFTLIVVLLSSISTPTSSHAATNRHDNNAISISAVASNGLSGVAATSLLYPPACTRWARGSQHWAGNCYVGYSRRTGYKYVTSGGMVLAVQRILQEYALRNNGKCHPGRADGLFGSRTSAAVACYQGRANISATGIVGPVTWTNLYNHLYFCGPERRGVRNYVMNYSRNCRRSRFPIRAVRSGNEYFYYVYCTNQRYVRMDVNPLRERCDPS
jgi:hypothetical protein